MIMQPARLARRGSALILAVIILMLVSVSAFITLGLSGTSFRAASEIGRRQRAEAVADAGLELVRAYFKDLQDKSNALGPNPFVGYDSLHLQVLLGGVRPIVRPDGSTIGEVAASVYVLGLDPASGDGRWVDPQSTHSHTGRVPSAYTTPQMAASAALQQNRRDVVVFLSAAVPSFADSGRWVATKEIAYSLALESSQVFDYAYFMHNWGWMAGPNGWTFNGNMRSNAKFSWLGGCTLNGAPRFNFSDTVALTDGNRMDDNGDGSKTNDGGTYAVVSVEGNAALGAPKDRYDEDNVDISADQLHPEAVKLPNINKQDYYDGLAATHVRQYDQAGTKLTTPDPDDKGSRLGVYDPSDPAADGTTGYVWYDEVIGDDEAKQNVVLVGDAAHPIIIDGPVVVRGGVMVRGVVTGQGAVYAKENIYIAGSIQYKNAPATKTPASNSTADINAWRADNIDKDAFGLFSAENVFFGQGDAPTSYFNHSDNNNAEASAGQDQVNNSADDAAGAGANVWETPTYSPGDIARLNPDTDLDGTPGDDPAGPQVGDPVPGMGEDVDGDGAEDVRSTVKADLTPPGIEKSSAPNSFGTAAGNFGGNRVLDAQWLGASRLAGWSATDGGSRYSAVATAANYIDAVIYSNHFVVGSMSGGASRLNGAIVARNECLYANGDFVINHDPRMLGGGSKYGFYLPREWKPPVVLYMRTVSGDE